MKTCLHNTWYAAMWSQDLASGQLLGRTITDVDLVFFRDSGGAPVALLDRCPHRFVPLSKGKLYANERLECPYHGLQFDSRGVCVHNPHAERIPAGAQVPRYPTVEKHSLIWIWMGSGEPDPARIPDFSVLCGGLPVTRRETVELKVNYQLMTDNLLDLSHVSFLHDGILGHEGMVRGELVISEAGSEVTAKRFTPGVKPPGMFDLMYRQDGQPVDLWADMRWNPPSSLLNYSGVCPPGGQREEGVYIHGAHILTPISELETRYLFAAAIHIPESLRRDEAAQAEVNKKLSELRRYAFQEQDEPMVLAQQNALLKEGGLQSIKPVYMTIDAGPLRARKILGQLIAEELEIKK